MSYNFREVPDGGLDYPRGSMLPKDAPAELLATYPAVMTIPYRPLLVEVDGVPVLLDTGAGPLGPGTGGLQASLKQAGVAAEDIQVVILSHAHADHVGGLTDAAGRPAFPNARIVISRAEYEFWRDSGIRERLGNGSVYGSEMIESVVRQWFERYLLPLEERLELVDGEAEVAPGVTMIPAQGHTPGHIAILIHNGAEPLLYTGDAFTLPEHVSQPEWTSSFDLDPGELVRTRARLSDIAVTEQCRVIHYHVGSIGRMARRGTRYAWEARAGTRDWRPDCRFVLAVT